MIGKDVRVWTGRGRSVEAGDFSRGVDSADSRRCISTWNGDTRDRVRAAIGHGV
jgi:hypothetical protein